MTARPGTILIPTSREEIDALADGNVLGSLLGRARSWQLQDDVEKLVAARPDATPHPPRRWVRVIPSTLTVPGSAESWTSTLQRAVSRRSNEPRARAIYYNRHVDGWLVSDRIGSTLVPFAPVGATQHSELTIATMDFGDRPHVGHATADTFWEAVDAAVKLNQPATPLVLRTDAADVVVNAALALVWSTCAMAVRDNVIRISFAKSAEWLTNNTFNDTKKLAPPVKFECSNGCSWLAPLRTLPTDADPILDLRGAP